MSKILQYFFYATLFIVTNTACAGIGDMHVGATTQASDWAQLPGGLSQDNLLEAAPALRNNCTVIGKTQTWSEFCAKLASTPNSQVVLLNLLQNELRPYQLTDGSNSQGVVTAYYEPIIDCSRQQGAGYVHAVYKPPNTYYNVAANGAVSRKGGEIPARSELMRNGSLNGNAIFFCKNAIDLYFMQVQGSGSARLPDGSVVRLAYAANNNQPSHPVAKWLAEKGIMPLAQTSKDNIRAWAERHPEQADEMLASNPRFVFFRELSITNSNEGSPGTLGVGLTPWRSVAVDVRYVPLGVPLFMSTQKPDGSPIQRVVAAQDTGAAIQGAVRVDFYLGFDAQAEQFAHRMKRSGQLWLLWPKASRP